MEQFYHGMSSVWQVLQEICVCADGDGASRALRLRDMIGLTQLRAHGSLAGTQTQAAQAHAGAEEAGLTRGLPDT